MKDKDSNPFRLRRRQFLANLLFAGGMVTLAGLQQAQAQQDPTDGWTLPDLNTPPTGPAPPPRRGDPAPPAPPSPPPRPVPPGKMIPPNPRGRVVTPPDGDFGPPKPGEVSAPPPPSRKSNP